MESIKFLLKQLFLQPKNWIEILILSVLIYYSIMFIRGTRTLAVLRGALLLALMYAIAKSFEYTTITMLFEKLGPVVLIALVILFAPEMRRALTVIGKQSFISKMIGSKSAIESIREAIRTLVNRQIGALIAIERTVGLRGYTHSGIVLDAEVSAPVLLNIFFPRSPLHDGGVIIENGRILAAACIFPLSTSPLSHIMGTRHRAALGLSEETDALVICISEETGKISLFENGKWDEGVSVAEVSRRLSEDAV
jgi:diadenylate cyclase